MQGDRLFSLEAFVEIVTFQHLRDREFRREADDAFKTQLVQPFRIKSDFRLPPIENFEDLLGIGLGVLVNLFAS